MGFERRKILYQVRIAAEVMLAHGGVNISLSFSDQQFISAQQIKKSISSYFHMVLFKEGQEFDK
jgi:hypothetical protein